MVKDRQTAPMSPSRPLDATARRVVTQTLLLFGKPLHVHGSEGRKGEDQGIGAALSGVKSGLLATFVAGIRTAIVRGVGVHDFAVEARMGDAQAIAFADYGSGVDDGDDEVIGIFATADESENAVVGIVGVNPFETMPVEIDLMKGRLGGVKTVEIAEEMPVEAASFAPFVTLGELLAHEEEFLARVGVLISVEKTKVGELLPQVAGHFVEKGIFSMDDFVVGEGEKEIFGEGVEQREGEFVVFVFAVHGIVGKIL